MAMLKIGNGQKIISVVCLLILLSLPFFLLSDDVKMKQEKWKRAWKNSNAICRSEGEEAMIAAELNIDERLILALLVTQLPLSFLFVV